MRVSLSVVLAVLAALTVFSAPAADFDGDGYDDVAVFRPSTGLWAIRGGARTYFGTDGDIPVPGKYLYTNRDSIAIYRPSTGLWAVEGSPDRRYFGVDGDIPIGGAGTGGGDGVWTQTGDDIYYNDGTVAIGSNLPGYAGLYIYYNSTVSYPQLKLWESANDFARINFLNTNTSNFFAIAARPQAITANARMNFYYNPTGDIMSITGAGRVGIGTTNPTSLLQVSADTSQVGLKVSGGVSSGSGYSIAEFYDGSGVLEFYFHGNGTAYARDSWDTFSPYISMQFIPEEMNKSDFEIGDLIAVINGKAVKTRRAYDGAVVGVVCPAEGFIANPKELKSEIMRGKKSRDDFNLVPVAYQGDVMVKVSDEGGEILSGDLIVPSSVPGVGMKGTLETIDRYAAVIGKARQDFSGREGLVSVAVGVK